MGSTERTIAIRYSSASSNYSLESLNMTASVVTHSPLCGARVGRGTMGEGNPPRPIKLTDVTDQAEFYSLLRQN